MNISPLRGLLEVTRLLRAREDLPALLQLVARTISETLGFGTVAVSLYRPAWDDFEVTAVHGSDAARNALLGNTREGAHLAVLLNDRFSRRGAYYIPSGSVDWDSLGRAERIEVLNGDTGATLDTRTVSGFSGGQYLLWNMSGHITIRVTNTGSGNAVVNGLFVDGATGLPSGAVPAP